MVYWDTSSGGKAIDDPYFGILNRDGTVPTSVVTVNQNTGGLDRFSRSAGLSNGHLAFGWNTDGGYTYRFFETDQNPVATEASLTNLGTDNVGARSTPTGSRRTTPGRP